jgi:hypothetical protein
MTCLDADGIAAEEGPTWQNEALRKKSSKKTIRRNKPDLFSDRFEFFFTASILPSG